MNLIKNTNSCSISGLLFSGSDNVKLFHISLPLNVL